MNHSTCSIEGCAKPSRTKSATPCKMHYHRQYRTGQAGEPGERKRKQRAPQCIVEGCAKPDDEVGLCHMHAARMRRHGNTQTVIAYADRDMPTGADNGRWMGDSIGYYGAHQRLSARQGSASDRPCVDCGSQAKHWSYNHSDANERIEHGISANGIAYSTNPEHYSPRCVSCHKAFDLGRLNATSA